MSGTIGIERDGGIVTVTLDNPDKRNAMTMPMYDAFGEAFEQLSGDDSVRCIVVRGAGERAFCAGSDIGEFEADRSGIGQAKAYAERANQATFRVRDCPHPTMALIQGVCVGGGLEIASLCDVRICGAGSRFGIPINRLGLTVDYDELAMLIELIGRRPALELLLEGRIFGAEEALRIGLVSRVVADDAVEAEADDAARRIANAAPLVNRWHKKFVRRLADPQPLSPVERDEAFACFETEDYRIGRAAFAEKTTPRFVGR